MSRVLWSSLILKLFAGVGFVDQDAARLEGRFQSAKQIALQIVENQHEIILFAVGAPGIEITNQKVDIHAALFGFLLRFFECDLGNIDDRYLPAQFREPNGVAAQSAGNVEGRSSLRE